MIIIIIDKQNGKSDALLGRLVNRLVDDITLTKRVAFVMDTLIQDFKN